MGACLEAAGGELLIVVFGLRAEGIKGEQPLGVASAAALVEDVLDVIGVFEVAVALVTARVGGDEVVCVIETEAIGKDLEGDALRGVAGRHRVTVGIQDDTAAGRDSNFTRDGGVGGHRRQRTQGGLFDEEEFGGLFAGFAVDAQVGDGVHPVACRRVHGTD